MVGTVPEPGLDPEVCVLNRCIPLLPKLLGKHRGHVSLHRKQGSQLGVCICCLGKRSRGTGGWGRGRGEREGLGSGHILGRTNRTWIVQHQKESGVPPVSAFGDSVQGDAIAKMVELSVLI